MSMLKLQGYIKTIYRRNIILETDVDLNSLIGVTFLMVNVVFQGHEECTPCKRPSDLSGKGDFAKVFKNSGGTRAKILSDGWLSVGDTLQMA